MGNSHFHSPDYIAAVRYEIHHKSTYTYDESVSIGHHLARLAPREMLHQHCEWHGVDVEPEPMSLAGHRDYYGNQCLFFALHGAHKTLTVTAHSFVVVNAPVLAPAAETPPWEALREAVRGDLLTPDVAAGEYTFASSMVKPAQQFADYALQSFTPGLPVLEGAIHLNERIFRDFKFDPAATDVATPVNEAFEKRRGVCQDFAHILIACIRSLGIPARYVSGYLETLPPPGKPKLVGADASHAWVSVWCGPVHQWQDLDPTNRCRPQDRHITVAFGRDFADVSPLRGVVYGSGEQSLKVSVDVTPR
jgi:transglutaminase-like putative cysteine protease